MANRLAQVRLWHYTWYRNRNFLHCLHSVTVIKAKGFRTMFGDLKSTVKGALYPGEVILEQIRRLLQAEAKTKLVGLGPEVSCESLLEKLDRLYSDVGAATESLTEAYQLKQGETEEVVAFTSRLDNRIR